MCQVVRSEAGVGLKPVSGMAMAKKRGPEIAQLEQAENEMEMVLYLAQSPRTDLHIFFQRPREEAIEKPRDNEAYVTFFSPRQGIPFRMGPNHFRLPLHRAGMYQRILALLKVFDSEIEGRSIAVHFGWPMSSWLDRFAIGIMVFNLMRLPRLFPTFHFHMSYLNPPATPKGVEQATGDKPPAR